MREALHITLAPVPPAAASQSVGVLHQAFRGDPNLAWCFLESEPGFEERLRAYLEIGHAWHAGQGHPVQGAFVDRELVGVAYAARPSLESSAESVLELEARLVEGCGREAAARFARYNRAIEEASPGGPVHVLSLVAVLPRCQGRGIGSRLVEWVGTLCDADATSRGVVLDTASERNLPFYARLGYRTVAEVSLDGLRQFVLFRPHAAA